MDAIPGKGSLPAGKRISARLLQSMRLQKMEALEHLLDISNFWIAEQDLIPMEMGREIQRSREKR